MSPDILNYIDRNNIATARLGSFEEDIGLKDNEYNTIISIFFVGYILTQIPTNLILVCHPKFYSHDFQLITNRTK